MDNGPFSFKVPLYCAVDPQGTDFVLDEALEKRTTCCSPDSKLKFARLLPPATHLTTMAIRTPCTTSTRTHVCHLWLEKAKILILIRASACWFMQQTSISQFSPSRGADRPLEDSFLAPYNNRNPVHLNQCPSCHDPTRVPLRRALRYNCSVPPELLFVNRHN